MNKWGFVVGCLVGLPSTLAAQGLTVQQPVVGSFGANTTLSVPDRGRALVGSVNSAAMGRVTYGPLPSGSALGLQTRSSSLSASVFIHDLQAMDEALLSAPTGLTKTNQSPWEERLAQRQGRSAAPSQNTPPPAPAARADHWEKLALQAESRGKQQVAQVYWRLAAKEGSELARAKLSPSPDTNSRSAQGIALSD